MNANTVAGAAQQLAALGWPVMPIKPHAKEPLTRHGVKDATTTERTILRWFDRWPDANLAVATGAPGPTVLDVDRPDQARHILDALRAIHAPTVAAVRGWHHYFRGTAQATVSLGFGELRGQGSYILVPPSIHPTGKQYVWLESPGGPLPPVPDILGAIHRPAGTGEFRAPELIPYGERHDALKDAAVRFLRAGFVDVPTLESMLQSFFQARCDPKPPPRKGEFRKLAEWAADTQIAGRERALEPDPPPAKTTKKKSGALDAPPRGDAPLKDHRDYIRLAAGLPGAVDIQTVIRRGQRDGDELVVELTNGQRVTFSQQHKAAKRHDWARTVISCTSGIANPPALNDWHAIQVLRSLCVLAAPPPGHREEDDLADLLADLLAIADPITDHDLGTPEGRYDLIARCRARPWNPRAHEREPDHRPVLIIDKRQTRYLRAGDLHAHLNHHGFGIDHGTMPGRMVMIGAERLELRGREQRRPDRQGRRTNRMVAYRLAAEAES